MRRTVTVVVLLAVIVGGLYAASVARKPAPPSPTTEEIWESEGIPVQTEAVIRGDMDRTIEVTGDVEALSKVVLSAKIPGRVAKVYVREGDKVSPGQTVVMLDQEDALSNLKQARAQLSAARAMLSQAQTSARVTKIQTDAGIEQAKANLEAAQATLKVVQDPARSQEKLSAENAVASAKANLDLATADRTRYKKLLEEGAISQSAYDVVNSRYLVAKANYDSAKQNLSLIKEGGRTENVLSAKSGVQIAEEQLRTAKANAAQNLLRQEDIKAAQASVQQAQAAVDLAEQQVSYTYIKSPIPGQIASRMVEPGQVVGAGQALADAVNLDSVFFKGDVSETALAEVAKGQKVRVRIDAVEGRVFAGVLDAIYPKGSSQSRNFPARIKITDTDGAVMPGMFARGQIVTGLYENAVLVPKSAIEERQGTKMVFAVGPDAAAKRYDVVVTHENAHYVLIKPDPQIKAGLELVTVGKGNLEDGSKLLLEEKGNKSAD